VVSGTLAHRDDIGWSGLVHAGEVQAMSAGTGITHSERNASVDEPLHFFQIWIEPDQTGRTPSYAQQPPRTRGGVALVAGPPGAGNALPLHADAGIHWGGLAEGERFRHPLAGRSAWVQLVSGSLELHGARLAPGDGAGLRGIDAVEIEARQPSRLLLLDLA
jgi:redox-sensitive bicupin YhaK (pirin superfamily)